MPDCQNELGERTPRDYRRDISIDVGFYADSTEEAQAKAMQMTREVAEYLFKREDVTFVETDLG